MRDVPHGQTQASILLFQESFQDQPHFESDRMWVLVGIKSRFLKTVVPGNRIVFTCKPSKMISTGSILMEGAGSVEGELVVKSTLTVAKASKKTPGMETVNAL